MDLFNDAFDPHLNLLPHDGTVNYHGAILGTAQADAYFTELNQTIDWQHDTARINGQIIHTARQVAWHASEPFTYTYSGTTKIALPWTDALLELKKIVEKQSHATYNACLLNRYNDGSQGMAWHSDAEKDLQKNGTIASISLGAERRFAFKHKCTDDTVSLTLQHGSLLIMADDTQTHWLHRLPPLVGVSSARINLTFRTMVTKQVR